MKLHALSTNGRPAHLQTQTRRPPTPHREYAIRRIQRGARPTGRASPHTPRRPNKASPRHHATTRAGPRRPLGTRRTAHRARSERATPCHPTTQRRVPRTPPRPPPTRKRITRASSDGARGDIMVLVVVAEVESRAERHAPDVGRCDLPTTAMQHPDISQAACARGCAVLKPAKERRLRRHVQEAANFACAGRCKWEHVQRGGAEGASATSRASSGSNDVASAKWFERYADDAASVKVRVVGGR